MLVARMRICSESEGSNGSDDTRGEEGGGGLERSDLRGYGFNSLLREEFARVDIQILRANDGG